MGLPVPLEKIGFFALFCVGAPPTSCYLPARQLSTKGIHHMLKHIFAAAVIATAGFSLAACSASTEDAATTDVDGQDEELINNSMCGGFAGIPCPDGYECKLAGNYPDAAGTCKKLKYEGKTCGGFVLHPPTCPKGYDCVHDPKTNPDLPGHCHKSPTCVQKVMCMSNAHFDTNLCQCVTDVTCKTLTCAKSYHCEMKGLNGGSTAVCIHN